MSSACVAYIVAARRHALGPCVPGPLFVRMNDATSVEEMLTGAGQTRQTLARIGIVVSRNLCALLRRTITYA